MPSLLLLLLILLAISAFFTFFYTRPIHQSNNSSNAPPMATAQSQAIAPLRFSQESINEQFQSPLFSIISPEIRNRIFQYALADFEDTSRPFEEQTCYRRPNQSAPRRTSTELLRTCKRIYSEAWFRPWISSEHQLWLTSEERRPPHATTQANLQSSLNRVHALHGDIEVDHVRVCAQLWALEPGQLLQTVLDMQHFHPLRITVTIRHTDFWWWERDQALRIAAQWVRDCRFPTSVREINVEIETLQRKKGQLDDLAEQMVNWWTFESRAGVLFSAKSIPVQITNWKGSSTWAGLRWIRDEGAPEELDYHVATITWRPVGTAQQCFEMGRPIKSGNSPDLNIRTSYRAIEGTGYLVVANLQAANVPAGTPGPEASAMLLEHRRKVSLAASQRFRIRRAARRNRELDQASGS